MIYSFLVLLVKFAFFYTFLFAFLAVIHFIWCRRLLVSGAQICDTRMMLIESGGFSCISFLAAYVFFSFP